MQENNVINLVRDFQQELSNIEIVPYNMDESYDHSGCTDFCYINRNLTTVTIYNLFGSTSAMNLFEKKLSLGLYKIYNPAGNFNLENFNDFAEICREKGKALLWNINPDDVEHSSMQQKVIKFFAPYRKFVNSFLENVLPIAEEYNRNNFFRLNRANAQSIAQRQAEDDLHLKNDTNELQ